MFLPCAHGANIVFPSFQKKKKNLRQKCNPLQDVPEDPEADCCGRVKDFPSSPSPRREKGGRRAVFHSNPTTARKSLPCTLPTSKSHEKERKTCQKLSKSDGIKMEESSKNSVTHKKLFFSIYLQEKFQSPDSTVLT